MRGLRMALAAVAVVALTAGAEAQGILQGAVSGGNKGNETDDRHPQAAGPPKEEPKKYSNEKDYKSSLDRLPTKKYDPWANTR